MLTTAKFKADYRCFKKGEKFEFRPGVNLLVGDQGTGKSSLLGLIRALAAGKFELEQAQKTINVKTVEGGCRILCYDFEKDNPRVAAHFNENTSMGYQMSVRFMSHGQSVKLVQDNLAGLERKREKHCFVMDEPDTGLSPRSAYGFIDQLTKLGKRHQVLAAVHNPLLIASQPEVLSLEHRKWMPSFDFLQAMKLPRTDQPPETP